ncbi:MAG: phenylalanine--tRNA ligase subunit beta [Candidatus Dojkabacteria bacterium]
MYISKAWLKKYVAEIDTVSDDELVQGITNSLAEVESVKKVGEGLSKLVVGEVKSVEKHKQADKLNVCQVFLGETLGGRQIVCGAPNVEKEQKVVVCLPGGSVYDSTTGRILVIGRTKIRGVESNGMICSEKELGISDEHAGIMVLENTYHAGEEIDALLRDTILEIENKSLTHRGDCFSHLGIAREIAAIFDLNFAEPEELTDPIQTDTLAFEINIETEKCLQFNALSIKGVEVKQSPFWLRYVLTNIGVRPVNNIVDVSNYILHDLGQPVHIYDYRKIADNKLVVREARKGEEFSGIDNQKYQTRGGEIVITDSSSVQAIGGVMGSKKSEVKDKTTDILIEVGEFEQTATLKAVRTHGLYTDASIRFSKGIDPKILKNALRLTTQFVGDLAGGDVASEIVSLSKSEAQDRRIKFDMQTIKRVTGINMEIAQVLDYLERLEIQIVNRNGLNQTDSIVTAAKEIELIIPARRKDLALDVDIVEEIARLYGYEKISPVAIIGELRPSKPNKISSAKGSLRSQFLQSGFQEARSYSFVGQELADLLGYKQRQLLKIENAISPELRYIRPSLLPSLLATLSTNAADNGLRKYFEIGRVAGAYKQIPAGGGKDIPYQPYSLGIISPAQNTNAVLEQLSLRSLLKIALGEKIHYSKLPENGFLELQSALHPNRSAGVFLKDELIGVIGEVSRQISTSKIGEEERLIFAEIDLEKYLKTESAGWGIFEPISKFQKVSRDISFWAEAQTDFGSLLDEVRDSLEAEEEIQARVSAKYSDYYIPESEVNRVGITIKISVSPQGDEIPRDKLNEALDRVGQRISKKYRLELR